MKSILVISILFFLFACGGGTEKDPKVILKKANNKCLEVRNGYYEMTKYMKYMSEKDTLKMTFKGHFKKLDDDTLFHKAFHFSEALDTIGTVDILYTGNELVTMTTLDSSAEVMAKNKWADEIKSYSQGYDFYRPLTNKDGMKLVHDSDFKKPANRYKLIGIETINDVESYHVKITEIPNKSNEESEMQMLRVQYDYWIDKQDFLPLQYAVLYVGIMEGETVYQYEKVVLDKFELNNLKDESSLQLSSIPSFYRKTDFMPYIEPKLLPNDTLAPNWELMTTAGKKIGLKSLKGKVVLIDFFYKSCYPCMQALPVLQGLSEKYKNKGLVVVEIDPYDTKEEGIAAFLAKRGVTYTILLGGEETAEQYKVSGYPTMYLIGKSGKIISTQVGYGKDVGTELEEIIKKNL